MGVIGIAGREGSGKTRACVEEIRALLRRGERALYLVPEQDTVEAELFLSRELNLDVLWNLEVLSPTRLAQRIRGEAGGSARVLLTDAGRAMALKGALLSLRGSLRYFSQAARARPTRSAIAGRAQERGERPYPPARGRGPHARGQRAGAEGLRPGRPVRGV